MFARLAEQLVAVYAALDSTKSVSDARILNPSDTEQKVMIPVLNLLHRHQSYVLGGVSDHQWNISCHIPVEMVV